MPSTVALLLWFILLMALLRYDPARKPETSWTVWIPVLWMFFMLSRLPSQWLGRRMGALAQALEEGNSMDRVVLFGLILVCIGILMRRSFQWGGFFGANAFLTALLFYSFVSFLWSDFSAIALKRWIRDLGNYLAILVVLSESYSTVEAVSGFLRRLSFLLIPLSVLMIKYYSYEAVTYSFWTGLPEYIGAATSKNTLGAACMLSGIYFLWDTVSRWSDRKESQTRRIILINITFIVMTVWLLRLANSATSQACLLLGWAVVLAFARWGTRRPKFIKAAIPIFLITYIVLVLFFDINDTLARMLGRDPTLTGRTNIWQTVLSTNTNPLLGTGYDSFWLGPRLAQVWAVAGPVNQAHNGYLEVYLNLGMIGVVLLVGLLITSYRNIWRHAAEARNLTSLTLALWTLALFYNLTEASFKPTFMCLTFLLGAVVVPVAQPSKMTARSFPSKALPQVDRRSRVEPKWVEINRLRQQRTLKPERD